MQRILRGFSMTLTDREALKLVNQTIEDLNEIARLLELGDVSEAEHWIDLVRRQWAARAYETVTGQPLHHQGKTYAKPNEKYEDF